MLDTILGWFYNIFDFCLDLWSSFFRLPGLFSLFITFFMIYLSVRFFIKPIIGGSDGVSGSINSARDSARRKEAKEKRRK